jgi:hypothetical protein
MSVIHGHTCIGDDGGTPNRRCLGCDAERNPIAELDRRCREILNHVTAENALRSFGALRVLGMGGVAAWELICQIIERQTTPLLRHDPRDSDFDRCDVCAVEAYERIVDEGLKIIHDERYGIYFMMGDAFHELPRRRRAA